MAFGLTDREAARLAGCSHVAIGKARRSGRLQSLADGTVEHDALVLWHEARRAPRGNRRQISNQPIEAATAPLVSAKFPLPMLADSDAVRDTEAALALLNAEGVFASRADAERYRDSYVARLRQIEFNERSGAVVDTAEAARKVGEACARVRNRLLALPAEQAPQLHRCRTVVELQDALLALITRALQELSA